MKTLSLTILASLLAIGPSVAQELNNVSSARPTRAPEGETSKPCLAVKDVGSHAFRNILLAGVAGALISKKQYQVVDALSYPARPGQKFHGDDLQTLQMGGTRVVLLNKNYTAQDLHGACPR